MRGEGREMHFHTRFLFVGDTETLDDPAANTESRKRQYSLTSSDSYKIDQLSWTVAASRTNRGRSPLERIPIMGCALPRNSLARSLTVASKKSYH